MTVTDDQKEQQVVSRQRVADHGEVYTAKREVNAMLDLVKEEMERIDSRFLEPAKIRIFHEKSNFCATFFIKFWFRRISRRLQAAVRRGGERRIVRCRLRESK